MQQTSKYQFKLIEGTDDFSPTPLNDNMEKVEEKLSELNDTVAQHTAAIGTGGHTCRIAFGSYQGTGTYGAGSPNSLTFDFCPVAVFIRADRLYYTAAYLRESPSGGSCWGSSYTVTVTWAETGVSWYNSEGSNYQNNATGYTYHYVVIGYSE